MTGAGLTALLAAVLTMAQGAPAREDILIADFEGDTYGAWACTGTAFGAGPARGTLKDQMAVTGFRGRGLVNTYLGGDAATGTITSPPFKIERRYINFLIGGGMLPGSAGINLIVAGKTVRSATGPNDRPGGSERLAWASWSVEELAGQTAAIEIFDRATGGWGHINVDEITQSDTRATEEAKIAPIYEETHRPQFHFTARTGWLNDPNGLVYERGVYHLFFQHNPFGTDWGNMTWGHAISRDLVHWVQQPNAIEPDKLGTIFSGSAVVDRGNTTGFGRSGSSPIVAIYTAAGGTSPESQGVPFSQCLAYSLDHGKTMVRYTGNPALPHIEASNRDPKVVWHAPTKRWIMALYLDREDYALFSSTDMKKWDRLQTLTMPGSSECPDFFEIPIAGEPGATRWVFTGANGRYLVGTFDGRTFAPEAGPFAADSGANYYAVQTYSDIPSSDGRRIQIAWMNGGAYPGMPFNQQMSFPCSLTLRRTADGLRLFRWPVREIAALVSSETKVVNLRLDGQKQVSADADLMDIEVVIQPGAATRCGLTVRGEKVVWSAADGAVSVLGRSAPLAVQDGRIALRVLLDRTSIETFGGGGSVSLTSCFLPREGDRAVSVWSEGGPVRVVSLRLRHLRSVWPAAAGGTR